MLMLTGLVLGVGKWDLPDSTWHWVGATSFAWGRDEPVPSGSPYHQHRHGSAGNRRNSPKESGGYNRFLRASGKIVTVVLGVVPGGRSGERAPAGRRSANSVGAEWPISVDYRMRKRASCPSRFRTFQRPAGRSELAGVLSLPKRRSLEMNHSELLPFPPKGRSAITLRCSVARRNASARGDRPLPNVSIV